MGTDVPEFTTNVMNNTLMFVFINCTNMEWGIILPLCSTQVVTVDGNLTGQCYWDEMLTPITDHNVLLLVLTTWCLITTLRLQ